MLSVPDFDSLCLPSCHLAPAHERQDPEIIAMTNLVDAYQRSDINEFERILRTNK